MAQVIKQAEEKFDVVLVDGANLQSFKETIAISPAVDGVVMVVSEGTPRKEVLAHFLTLLERKKARVVGAILNNRTFFVPRFLYERA
jgi:Mrp family chromosome partitioning ATPase